MSHPGHLSLLESREPTHTLKKRLQAIQVQIDKILRLGTNFVSVVLGLALLRECESNVLRLVSWFLIEPTCILVLRLPGALWFTGYVIDPDLVWSGVDSLCAGGCGDPLL